MNCLHHAIFPSLADARWIKLNFDEEARRSNILGNDLVDPEKCDNWVRKIHQKNDAEFSYGGWMEDRSYLWRDHYHKDGKTTHVGVDYNVPAGTVVHLPQAGRLIMVEEDPDQNGGWGTRMIFRIGNFFVTFAHLGMQLSTVGTNYYTGRPIAMIGDHTCNGGWFPHLHVQVQRKYEPYKDGYQLYTKELEFEYLDPECILCINPLVSITTPPI